MAGGAAGAVAGGGGGGGGGAGGDGIAERWCGICRKSYTRRWWMSRHHQPRCLKERQEDARLQRNAARDRGQRMATQRAKDRKKSKQEKKKGTASSKSKAQNTKRSHN